jgi:hypothetical protein
MWRTSEEEYGYPLFLRTYYFHFMSQTKQSLCVCVCVCVRYISYASLCLFQIQFYTHSTLAISTHTHRIIN